MLIQKEEFITRMAEKGNTTKCSCRWYLNLMLGTMFDLLREGAVIRFQRIMRIEVVDVAEKETYNIATGKRFVLPEHKCIKIRVSKVMQDKFNKAIDDQVRLQP